MYNIACLDHLMDILPKNLEIFRYVDTNKYLTQSYS